MGIMILRIFASIFVGVYFGKLHNEGKVSFAKGLILAVTLSIILSLAIDFIISR